jgi:hypothetical protein
MKRREFISLLGGVGRMAVRGAGAAAGTPVVGLCATCVRTRLLRQQRPGNCYSSTRGPKYCVSARAHRLSN